MINIFSTVTVETGGDSGGRKFKPIDLIHLVNPIDFLKEPLDNILSKLGKAGKFAKNVGKHLVKGLKFIAKGFDKTVIDGLKVSRIYCLLSLSVIVSIFISDSQLTCTKCDEFGILSGVKVLRMIA